MEKKQGLKGIHIVILAVVLSLLVALLIGVGMHLFGSNEAEAVVESTDADKVVEVSKESESTETVEEDLGELQVIQLNPERVLDYGDMLSEEEEANLEEYIAECESKYEIHFALVVLNEDVQGDGDWDTEMRACAEEHYEENGYGYEGAGGDGVLFLDNWYGNQAGSYLLLVDGVCDIIDDAGINRVLGEVYQYIESNPYAAYKAYIDEICEILDEAKEAEAE